MEEKCMNDNIRCGEVLPMTTAISIAEFRKDMRKLLEMAISGREVICFDAKSRDRETCSFIKTGLFQDILKAYSFKPVVFLDDETMTYNIHLDELKLYAYAATVEEATEQLVDLVIDYSRDYIDRLGLFLNVSDRKEQYPYVLRISHCRNRDEIKRLLFGSN
jgi:hypothetical protein